MSRRRTSVAERRRHDRRALIQWLVIGLVVAGGLGAALLLTDGDGGVHTNAPPLDGPPTAQIAGTETVSTT